MPQNKPNSEKGYIGDDRTLGYFGYAGDKADETMKDLTKDVADVIKTLSETGDPELTILILHDWKSRIDHLFGIVFRRTIEALTSAKTIKTLLDKGHDKKEVYSMTAGAIAKTMDADEFSVVIGDIDEVLRLYYGIDDFLTVLEGVAKQFKDHYEKDVF